MRPSLVAGALRTRLCASGCASTSKIEAIHPARRVIPLSRSHHVRGWHPVRHNHSPIQFESKLESRVISALVGYSELIRIQSQPVTVVFRHEGRVRRYTPDFLVALTSVPQDLARLGFGLETFIEVKPLSRATVSEWELALKFSVIRDAMAQPITLITELDLAPTVREVRHGA